MINMSNLSINTGFIGYAENVDLTERKTTGLNAESEPYTLSKVAIALGLQQLQPIEVVTNGRITGVIPEEPNFMLTVENQFINYFNVGNNYIENIPYSNINQYDADIYNECTEITFNNLVCSKVAFELSTSIYTFNFPDLEYVAGYIRFEQPNMQVINAPVLKKQFVDIFNYDSFIKFKNCGDLETINMPLLEEAILYFESCYPSDGLYLPSFKKVISLNITNTTIPQLSFTSDNIPVEVLGKITFSAVTGFQSVSFTTLKYLNLSGAINFYQCTDVESFSIPNVIEYMTNSSPIRFQENASLTDVSLGTIGVLKKVANGQDITAIDCPLSEESVDGILALFASLDGTNGTTLSENGLLNLQSLCSPPSVTGLANKAILESRGWVVNVN